MVLHCIWWPVYCVYYVCILWHWMTFIFIYACLWFSCGTPKCQRKNFQNSIIYMVTSEHEKNAIKNIWLIKYGHVIFHTKMKWEIPPPIGNICIYLCKYLRIKKYVFSGHFFIYFTPKSNGQKEDILLIINLFLFLINIIIIFGK